MRHLAAVAAAFFVNPIVRPPVQPDVRVVPWQRPVETPRLHVPRASGPADRSRSSLDGARVLAASFCAVLAAARPARLALQGRKSAARKAVTTAPAARKAVPGAEAAAKPDVRLLRLARKRRFADAEAIHVGLAAKGKSLDTGTVSAFLREAVAAGQVDVALRAFRRHKAKSRELYTDFIASLAARKVRGRKIDQVVRRRRCATAISLLRELQASGLGLDAVALGAGVCAFMGANRRGDAKRVLLKAKRSGIPVRTNVYNVYLRELSESRDVDGLQRKLSRMAARGVERNQVTNATVVNAFVKARRIDLAEEALEAAGPSAGVEAYGALLGGYARTKQFDFARGVLEQMTRDGVTPNGIVYHDLMHRLILDGRLREALQVSREMKKAGLPFELAHYNTLLRGLGCNGNFSSAFKLLEEMHQRGTPPVVTSYNILLDAAMQQSNSEGRLAQVVRAMRNDGLSPDPATFTTLVKNSKGAGDLGRVRGLLAQAESLGVKPDRTMYTAFLGALARGGALDEAEELVRRMSRDIATRPDRVTFTVLSRGYFMAGRTSAAMELFTRATESRERLDAYFFNGYIMNLVRAQCYDDVVLVAEEAERRGITVDRGKFSEMFALRSDEECSALERFKFWLGIPNQIYSEDWRTRKKRPPRSTGAAPRYPRDLNTSFISTTQAPAWLRS